jgi:hypothetical protein
MLGLPIKPATNTLCRVIVQLLRRIDLLQDAILHDGDAAGHGHGFHLVVRHINEGGGQALVQAGELGARLHAQLRIQVRQRLVEKEHGRLTHDGATHGDALALTTGELLGLAVQQVANVQNVGGFFYAAVDLRFGSLAQFQTKGHVVIDTHVRVQSIALEHHRDVAILGWDIIHNTIADQDIPLGDLLQPCQHAQAGGLAAARRTHEDDEFLVLDVDVEVADCSDIAVPLVHVVVRYTCHNAFFSLSSNRNSLKLMRIVGHVPMHAV